MASGSQGTRSPTADLEINKMVASYLRELTSRPGQVGQVSIRLANILPYACIDYESMRQVVVVIIEHAITEPNSAYKLSRLCDILTKNMRPNNEHAGADSFRHALLEMCHKECAQMDVTLDTDHDRRQALCIFLGELYESLDKIENGVFTKEDSLADEVLNMLQEFLRGPNNEACGVVSKVLKQVGHCLDELESRRCTGPRTKMDLLVEKINALSKDPPDDLDEEAVALLANVVTLRDNNWGQPRPRDVRFGLPR